MGHPKYGVAYDVAGDDVGFDGDVVVPVSDGSGRNELIVEHYTDTSSDDPQIASWTTQEFEDLVYTGVLRERNV